jgi:hypothetical protein
MYVYVVRRCAMVKVPPPPLYIRHFSLGGYQYLATLGTNISIVLAQNDWSLHVCSLSTINANRLTALYFYKTLKLTTLPYFFIITLLFLFLLKCD